MRFTPRRDPYAPLLTLLHPDGSDERAMLALGRSIWPGAPMLRPRGSLQDGAGWRFLRCPAPSMADLEQEACLIDALAAAIDHAVRTREATLVEVVPIGVEGGADALVGLLCRHPKHIAAAILYRPRRIWRPLPLTGEPMMGGVEVLVVTEAFDISQAEAAAALLVHRGARVTVEVQGRSPAPTPEVALGRSWLQRQLRGCEE